MEIILQPFPGQDLLYVQRRLAICQWREEHIGPCDDCYDCNGSRPDRHKGLVGQPLADRDEKGAMAGARIGVVVVIGIVGCERSLGIGSVRGH